MYLFLVKLLFSSVLLTLTLYSTVTKLI